MKTPRRSATLAPSRYIIEKEGGKERGGAAQQPDHRTPQRRHDVHALGLVHAGAVALPPLLHVLILGLFSSSDGTNTHTTVHRH
jgi:hypothetical protein